MSKYMLEVVTKYEQGYGSHVYGWSNDPIFKSKRAAMKKKKEIESLYYEVILVTV